MRIKWPKNISEALEMQERHKSLVQLLPLSAEPRFVAGLDAAFSEEKVFAAACLYQYPEMTLIEQTAAVEDLLFPYVPGFLLFLEGPALIAAIRRLKTKPDLLLVDGQGIAHPRGIGSASHLGVLLDMPTIGCAKTVLTGEFREPGASKGNWSELHVHGKTAGAVLRTRDNVRPLYLSPGHKVSIEDAVRIGLTCCSTRFRIPEPLRCADILSKKIRSQSRK